MADISVNIRGRDDGFGSMLDSLREKTSQLGKETSNLGSLSNLTKTEKRLEIENSQKEVTNSRKQSVMDDYRELKEANLRDFNKSSDDFLNNRISKKEYNQSKESFNQSNKDLNDEEANELVQIEKESNAYLKEILRQLSIQERLDREREQRDGKEFEDGSIGSILQKNSNLRSMQNSSSDDDEISALQKQIDENNRTIRGMRSGNSADDEDNKGNGKFASGLQMGAGAAARGDLSGTLSGGLQAAAGLGGVAAAATGVGIVAMIVKEFMSHGEKIQEAIGQSASMRGGLGTGGQSNVNFQKKIGDMNDQLGALGLTGEEFASMVNQKATSSRVGGNNLTERTLNDVSFQKGFGADVGIFSQFERFNKNQEASTTVGLDVLNVLTSIDKSSLKENDLSTLAEKLQSQQALMTIQRSKRDIVDNDSALRTLAAFEKIGLSGKGEKGGDFLTNTIQSLGKGGNEMVQLAKYQAMKEAHPELANDPAGLERAMRFRSDDPEYIIKMAQMVKKRSGGDKMVEDAWNYSLYDDKSEYDLDMHGKMSSKEFQDTIRGKGVNKTRKSTLDEATMTSDAQSSVGQINTTMTNFSNDMQDLLIEMKDTFKNGIKIINWPSWFSSNSTRSGGR